MVSAEKIDILSELETFLRELQYYRYSRLFGGARRLPISQTAYIANLRDKLLRDVGRFKFLIAELIRKEDVEISEAGSIYSSDMWIRGLKSEFDLTASQVLNYCIDVTNVAMGKLQDDIRRGYRNIQGNPIEKPQIVETEPPKAFISHGKESVALTKVSEFLRAIGIEPVAIKQKASLDQTLPDKVKYYLERSEFVVILATGDDKIKGKLHPRQNVIHEIGLAQATHAGKIIYLLEENTEFPSNISPKVWEKFDRKNIEKVYLHIVLEFKEFGKSKAVIP